MERSAKHLVRAGTRPSARTLLPALSATTLLVSLACFLINLLNPFASEVVTWSDIFEHTHIESECIQRHSRVFD